MRLWIPGREIGEAHAEFEGEAGRDAPGILDEPLAELHLGKANGDAVGLRVGLEIADQSVGERVVRVAGIVLVDGKVEAAAKRRRRVPFVLKVEFVVVAGLEGMAAGGYRD